MKTLLFFLFLFNAYASVESLDSLVESKALQVSNDTLVVLDVDGTLINSEDFFIMANAIRCLWAL